MATTGKDLKIWDSTNGSEIRKRPGTYGLASDRLQFSQDSKCIYTYDNDVGFKTWDIASGSLVPYSAEHPTG